MHNDVLMLTGAGQIGMAIARRMGMDKKIIIGDKNINNANTIAATMKMPALMRKQWKWT